MLEDTSPNPFICDLKRISFYLIHENYRKHLQVADHLQSKPCFLKMIPGVLGHSVYIKTPQSLLCRRPDGPFLVTMI